MKIKFCSKCNKELILSCFPKGNSSLGKSSWCKKCHNEYNKSNITDRKNEKYLYYLEQKQKYPWINSYKNARARCNNFNREDYKNYGGRGIKFLLTFEEFGILWNRDNASLMKKPSIDRIDNNSDYTFENCHFIEFVKNVKKSIKHRKRSNIGRFLSKEKPKGSK